MNRSPTVVVAFVRLDIVAVMGAVPKDENYSVVGCFESSTMIAAHYVVVDVDVDDVDDIVVVVV